MNRVSAERKLKGMNQVQLAQELKVSESTVVKWEAGEGINQENIIKMRNLFGCDIDWLLGLSDVRRTIVRQ